MQKIGVAQSNDAQMPPSVRRLRSWLLCWELYLIVLVAGLLRLYRLNATEFDMDQANIFGMAWYALHHGLLVATSNLASIGLNNPPAIIYLLMPPAAVSADPLWGAVLVALCATLSVALTYVFVRRYYGRVAATIAAAIYATASLPIFYSRFMWQQNFLLLFVLLYLMSLFRGVVSRRPGWLFPALFLQGLLFQLHGSTIYLVPLLLIALLLAPWKTLRWRDLALGLLSLLVIYFPYLLWELHVNISDISILLHPTDHAPRIDNQAWLFYRLMLSPYNLVGEHSLLASLVPWIKWLRQAVIALVICGALLALVQIVWPPRRGEPSDSRRRGLPAWLWRPWLALRSDPYRCGLVLLLAWQVIPMLALTRHAIDLFPHYTIIFVPGQFILIGYFLATVARWLQQCARRLRFIALPVGLACYALAALIVLAQFAGSSAAVLDAVRGNFVDPVLSNRYYTTLSAYQHAVAQADTLAQQRHLNHVYISTDFTMQSSLRYLAATQMRTPATVFNDTCVVLPAPSAGPAVLLVGAYSDFTNALVSRFAHATLVEQPPRPGSVPFHLYVIDSGSQPATPRATFANHLNFLDATPFTYSGVSQLVTRWSTLRTAPSDYLTTYTYNMVASAGNQSSQCTFTSLRPGDQLLLPFQHAQPPFAVTAQYYATQPYNLPFGPLSFETDVFQSGPHQRLQTSEGGASITIPPVKS